MRVHVYLFMSRSSLIEPERLHPVDDHLIRAMHIESIYDVYVYAGCIELSELEKTGLDGNIVFKLRRYGEALVKGDEAKRIASLLGFNGDVKFIVIRRSGG